MFATVMTGDAWHNYAMPDRMAPGELSRTISSTPD